MVLAAKRMFHVLTFLQMLCTRFRARLAMLGLLFLMLAANVHCFWVMELMETPFGGLACNMKKQFTYFMFNVYFPIHMILYSFAPSVIMITCNFLAVRQVSEKHDFSECAVNNLFKSVPCEEIIQPRCFFQVRQSEITTVELGSTAKSILTEARKMLTMMLIVTGYYVISTLAKSIYLLGEYTPPCTTFLLTDTEVLCLLLSPRSNTNN